MPERFPETLEQLLEWERENLRPKEQDGVLISLVPRRVFFPLFNLETGDTQHTREIRSPKGIRFRLSTWDISKEVEIRVPMEWDLQKNEWTGHAWNGRT